MGIVVLIYYIQVGLELLSMFDRVRCVRDDPSTLPFWSRVHSQALCISRSCGLPS
jgi:hypothetical protein